MDLSEILNATSLKGTRVVTGSQSLNRTVRWVHVVDIPNPRQSAQPGQLILTTGYSWPKENSALRQLIDIYIDREVAAIGLAVPAYVARFPQVMLQAAERVGLPLFEIPWEVRFAHVTEEVNTAIVDEQIRQIGHADALHQRMIEAAVEAETLQDLAEIVATISKRPILIADMKGFVLGLQPHGHVDDYFTTAAQAGRVPEDFVELLQHPSFRAQLMGRVGASRIAPSAIGSMTRICAVIRVKNDPIGILQILDDGEANDLILRVADQAAVIAALHIVNEGRLALLEARLGSSFLASIIDGNFDVDETGLERAGKWGFENETVFKVFVAVLNEKSPLSREGSTLRDSIADECRRRFRTPGGAPIDVATLNQIIVVIPTDRVDPDQLAAFFLKQGLGIVSGRSHRGLPGIHRSYQEAKSLVPYSRTAEYQDYDELLIPRILLGDEEARDALLADLLGPLTTRRDGDVLIDALMSLAMHGFHYGETAQATHMHLNTLRNRIARACELTGIDITDTETRFKLQMAARLRNLDR